MNHEMPKGTPATPMPSNRYILPQFEERTPYGFKRQDPYAYLFEDRIIFLGTQEDNAIFEEVSVRVLTFETIRGTFFELWQDVTVRGHRCSRGALWHFVVH